MRRIDIDEHVYAKLASLVNGFEQPNDVLRRLLGLSDTPTSDTVGGKARAIKGELAQLLDAGLMTSGDQLIHVQKRKGRTFFGRVDEDGWVITQRGRYRYPSPALGELVGTQISGKAFWTHEPSGKTLAALEDLAVEMRA